MRRVAVSAGVVALIAGVALAVVPFDHTLRTSGPGGSPSVVLDNDCGVPLASAFRGESDGGWFAYAPNTHPISVGSFGCRTEARWRAGGGSALAVAGLALMIVVLSLKRGVRDASSASPSPASA